MLVGERCGVHCDRIREDRDLVTALVTAGDRIVREDRDRVTAGERCAVRDRIGRSELPSATAYSASIPTEINTTAGIMNMSQLPNG